MKKEYYKLPERFLPLLVSILTIIMSACADEDLVNNNQNSQLDVHFNIVDGQQTAFSKHSSGLTRSASIVPISNSDLASKKLLADDNQHCLIQTTIEGVNPIIAGPKTRGTVIKKTNLGDFSSSAYRGTSSSAISNTPTWFYQQKTNANGTLANHFQWAGAEPYARFYAVYPEIKSSDNKIKLSDESYSGTPYVDFEVEQDVEKQKDLLTACTGEVIYNTPGVAPETNLMFQHALTAVKFSVGPNLSPMTINKIEIQNVLYKGRYTFPTEYNSPGTWDLSAHQSERTTVTLNCNPGEDASKMPNTLIVGKEGSNYTFFMLPQTLTGNSVKAKVYYTTHDGQSKTMTITLTGSWIQGTTSEYKLSLKKSAWENHLTVSPIATFEYDGSTDYNEGDGLIYVDSYREINGTSYKQPVAWEVVKYEESDDDGHSWVDKGMNRPEWLNELDKSQGDGGDLTGAVPTVATDQISPSVHAAIMKDYLTPYNKILKNENPKGSSGNPFNLANPTNGSSSDIQESTNSYLISAPGYYRIPLVYGNAIKENKIRKGTYISSAPVTNIGYGYESLNLTADGILHHFVDHNNNPITNPLINGQNSTDKAEKVYIRWEDQPNLVRESSFHFKSYPTTITDENGTVIATTVDFVEFEVTKDDILNGNLSFAIVSHSGKTMWAWHLWFDHKDALDQIPCKNADNITYNFSRRTLGYTMLKWEETTYSKSRKVRITIRQKAGSTMSGVPSSAQEASFIVKQKPGVNLEDRAPVFQAGMNFSYVAYGFYDYINSKTGDQGSRGHASSVGDFISHPDVFFCSDDYRNATAFPTPYLNLWSINNDKVDNFSNDKVDKTIYDPCPAGFHVPESKAFTGFYKTDGTPNTKSIDLNDRHYFFYTEPNPSAHTPTIRFENLSYRFVWYGGIVLYNGINYWTAMPVKVDENYTFKAQYGAAATQDFSRSFGFNIRPVADR